MVYYIVSGSLLMFFWCPCMAINVNVQYNGGFLPDIILWTQCYLHRGTCLKVMKRFCICSLLILPKRFDIFSPITGGCSEGLDVSDFSLNSITDSSRVPRRRPFIYIKPPYAIGSVPRLSGHAIAYRWRSLPRVRRHEASKPHGSSKRALPWQVTMDQSICASLSHTDYK